MYHFIQIYISIQHEHPNTRYRIGAMPPGFLLPFGFLAWLVGQGLMKLANVMMQHPGGHLQSGRCKDLRGLAEVGLTDFQKKYSASGISV
jgi:hypothetical protein